MWDTFWHFLRSTIVIFAFVAYLLILFNILLDLFWRDRKTSGFIKAIWVILLIVLPYITAFVYLIFRGKGMAERAYEQASTSKKQTDDYIREVAGRSPTQDIADAKNLLDAGAITQTEFERLKAGALSR